MERSCRKMEESLVKADREYRDSNIKTEETRLGWESAMYKCCNVSCRHAYMYFFNPVLGSIFEQP